MKQETQRAIRELKKYEDKEKKVILQRFFKTGIGEYGEGDVFLGVTVPKTRSVAKQFKGLILKDIQELLLNKHHEVRLMGLLILVEKYEETKKKSNEKETKRIVDFYVKNLKKANNWDLIDLSCYKILGDYLVDKERRILYELIKSKNLWERRAGIVSTLALIKKGELDDAFELSKRLLKDEEELIHKATGWVLREAGKKDEARLETFLEENTKNVPRVTLRYAIERFPEKERKKFLKKTV